MRGIRIAPSGQGAGEAPVSVALELGVFERAGLEPEIVPVGGGASAIARALQAGEVDFAIHPASAVVTTNLDGGDLVMLASVAGRNLHTIVTPPEISDPAQLAGRRLGIRGPGGQDDISLRMACRAWGLEPGRDVDIVVVGERRDQWEALRRRDIAAFSVTAPWTFLAADAGFRLLHSFAAASGPYQLGALVARRALVRADPALAQAVVTAVVEAMRAFALDPELGRRHIAATTTITSPSVLERTYEVFRAELCPRPVPLAEATANVITSLLPFHPRAGEIRPADVIDRRFLDALEGRLLPIDGAAAG